MRKALKAVESPPLTVHIDYDYLTVGELGNILIRLQAALKSLAGDLRPDEQDRRLNARPYFITSYISTKNSIDIAMLLAVLAIAMGAPSAIKNWRMFSAEVFRRFKIAVFAMARGEIKAPEALEEYEEVISESLKVEVTRGEININASRPFLNELTPIQRRRLSYFIDSIIAPANRVEIGDEESQISFEWREGENNWR